MTASRTGARPVPGDATRERLLDTAAELFYQEGVGIGIQALAKAAGVSKRSMYELFASKDELLTAAVEQATPGLLDILIPRTGAPDEPRARILHLFEQLERLAATPGYRGCPFLSVQVELKDPEHPASRAAAAAKNRMRDFFRDEAARGGAADPETLAQQLIMLYDGGSTRAGAAGEKLDGITLTTATALLDAAGVR
ncbi:TetR/AcrR family transcriptional regulator [Streptomyces liangshanensis]|uniref:TetR/AcrR family transcriptional regulator n=1 Tax=Streptomyces liangshanensis TaxID=2717324 RepID=UPI0036DA77C4